MAHTQGPWVVKFQESKRGTTHYTDKYWHDQWVIKGPDKKHSPVATVRVAGYGMGPSMAVREANARLIAAAPDLLAALEKIVDLERRKLGGTVLQMIAEGALAKAKGIQGIPG